MRTTIIGNAHDLNAAQEIWFIQNVLFSGSHINIGFDPELLCNQIVIYLELNEISGELIDCLRSAGNKVVLYHMGDELGEMRRSQYQNCDLVIRNYYYKEAFVGNGEVETFWAPCGFKNGVGPRDQKLIKPANRREWLASFFGWLDNPRSYRNERAEFSSAVDKCDSNIFVQPSAGFAQGWNPGLYAIAMESSIFSPCPAGNTSETIRLYDALELGCIPISLPHHFLFSEEALALIGPVPFPILNSWTELPVFLEKMKAKILINPNEVMELQQRCIIWWSHFKVAIQEKITKKIQAL